MGADLPLTSPLSGAIVRWIRKVIFIRSRLLDSTDRAGDLRAGRQSRPLTDRVSTAMDDIVGKVTGATEPAVPPPPIRDRYAAG